MTPSPRVHMIFELFDRQSKPIAVVDTEAQAGDFVDAIRRAGSEAVCKSCPMNPTIEEVVPNGLYFLKDHQWARQYGGRRR